MTYQGKVRGADDNFLALDTADAHPDTAGAVILPVPFEATSTFGHGSAAGPEAIVSASRELELFDTMLGGEPYRLAGGIATLPDLDVSGLDGAQLSERLEAEVGRWIEADKFVVTLGGEHSSVVGAAYAHAKRFSDLSILQLDAHSDLRPEYLGSPWNHACAAARILDVHSEVVQVGIRSQAAEERAISEELGLAVFYAHTVHDHPGGDTGWIEDLLHKLRSNIYITLDCDVFDPSLIPATGTPEPGGLTWIQIDRLIRKLCRERRVVGMDVSELAPVKGLHHPQFSMAKLISRVIGNRFKALAGRS